MQLEIGSQILYEDETMNGGGTKGKIIAVAQNRVNMVTTYLAQLVSGEYVQIKPDNLCRCSLI